VLDADAGADEDQREIAVRRVAKRRLQDPPPRDGRRDGEPPGERGKAEVAEDPPLDAPEQS